MKEEGFFCQTFGSSPRNRILEFFLEMRDTDYGIADIARNLDMNKATAYAAAEDLIEKKILIPTRIIGRTQLYTLNKKDMRAKIVLYAFDQLLKNKGRKQEDEELATVEV